jgi:hypothetical protein
MMAYAAGRQPHIQSTGEWICSAQRQLYMFAHHQLSVANRLKNSCKYISRRKTHVATARRSDYVNNSITFPPPLKKITRRDIEMTYRHIFYL